MSKRDHDDLEENTLVPSEEEQVKKSRTEDKSPEIPPVQNEVDPILKRLLDYFHDHSAAAFRTRNGTPQLADKDSEEEDCYHETIRPAKDSTVIKYVQRQITMSFVPFDNYLYEIIVEKPVDGLYVIKTAMGTGCVNDPHTYKVKGENVWKFVMEGFIPKNKVVMKLLAVSLEEGWEPAYM